MNNSADTLHLLRECSAGIKTAVTSIDDVLPYVADEEFKNILTSSRAEHKAIEKDVDEALKKINANGKEPNIMAKGMSKIKINAEMTVKPNEAQAASLITDGCGMGIKSINKYLNEYSGADKSVKKIVDDIIRIEEDLVEKMKAYL